MASRWVLVVAVAAVLMPTLLIASHAQRSLQRASVDIAPTTTFPGIVSLLLIQTVAFGLLVPLAWQCAGRLFPLLRVLTIVAFGALPLLYATAFIHPFLLKLSGGIDTPSVGHHTGRRLFRLSDECLANRLLERTHRRKFCFAAILRCLSAGGARTSLAWDGPVPIAALCPADSYRGRSQPSGNGCGRARPLRSKGSQANTRRPLLTRLQAFVTSNVISLAAVIVALLSALFAYQANSMQAETRARAQADQVVLLQIGPAPDT